MKGGFSGGQPAQLVGIVRDVFIRPRLHQLINWQRCEQLLDLNGWKMQQEWSTGSELCPWEPQVCVNTEGVADYEIHLLIFSDILQQFALSPLTQLNSLIVNAL